jgi:hypothetical protein
MPSHRSNKVICGVSIALTHLLDARALICRVISATRLSLQHTTCTLSSLSEFILLVVRGCCKHHPLWLSPRARLILEPVSTCGAVNVGAQ